MQRTKNKVVVLVTVLITAVSATLAQNGTNSPYTRYGYGDLANRSFGAGRAMGGTGVGLRSSKQINPLNPASYSCIDSLTFMFDFGAMAQLSWFNDGVSSQSDLNGNVNYMAMQFPIYKRAAMSFGLLPYSHVGYSFGETKQAQGETYSEVYAGTGGLNQIYAGVSIDVWKKRLSVGTNISYLFGEITHASTSTYSSTNATAVYSARQYNIGSAIFDLGVQYVHPLTKTERLVGGVTYSPQFNLSAVTYESQTSTTYATDTIRGLRYNLPASYGFGISYVKDDKLLVAADVTYQQWKGVKIAGREGEFNDRIKVAAGAELIPNFYSRPYFNKVRYRAGAAYANSYVSLNGKSYNELCATLGAGFPVTDARSYVNVSFEYVNLRPETKTMITEHYFRMTVSYTFNELWFFKRRLD